MRLLVVLLSVISALAVTPDYAFVKLNVTPPVLDYGGHDIVGIDDYDIVCEIFGIKEHRDEPVINGTESRDVFVDDTAYQSLRCFDPESNTWFLPETSTPAPSRREWFRMAIDKTTNNIYLFGGARMTFLPEPAPPITTIGDFWVINPSNWTWVNLTAPSSGTLPNRAAGTSLAFDQDGNLYTHGGLSFGCCIKGSPNFICNNVTKKYIPATNSWQTLATWGDIPCVGRHDAHIFNINGTKYMYSFGGQSSLEMYVNKTITSAPAYVKDVFRLNLDTLEWQKLNFDPDVRHERQGHRFCVLGNVAYIDGGDAGNCTETDRMLLSTTAFDVKRKRVYNEFVPGYSGVRINKESRCACLENRGECYCTGGYEGILSDGNCPWCTNADQTYINDVVRFKPQKHLRQARRFFNDYED